MKIKRAPSGWKMYFPDDGETPDDAGDIHLFEWQKIFSAEDAATYACEYDYNERDGWERIGHEFPIAVISPKGEVATFLGYHEPSIEHHVRECPDEVRHD